MFDNKVIFFIITVIATKGKRLYFNIKVSKAMFYIAQNQNNMKMNPSNLPLKKERKNRKERKKRTKYSTRKGRKNVVRNLKLLNSRKEEWGTNNSCFTS